MTRQPVSCATITQQAATPFVLYHQHLGCFHSDWHQHAWGQLIYAEQGSIHLHCRGQKRLVPSWYAVWIPPNTDHETWSDSPQLFMRAICLPIAANEYRLSEQLAVFPVSTLLREMIRHTQQWNQDETYSKQAITFVCAIQQLLPTVFDKALPICLPATTHQQLAPIADYIQQHLCEPLSQQHLAHHFGVSVRTLSRLFTQQLGTTFTEYCRTARIHRALELIEAGADNVSQLADDVGYETIASFSNTFLSLCGRRPLSFIQERKRSASFHTTE